MQQHLLHNDRIHRRSRQVVIIAKSVDHDPLQGARRREQLAVVVTGAVRIGSQAVESVVRRQLHAVRFLVVLEVVPDPPGPAWVGGAGVRWFRNKKNDSNINYHALLEVRATPRARWPVR